MKKILLFLLLIVSGLNLPAQKIAIYRSGSLILKVNGLPDLSGKMRTGDSIVLAAGLYAWPASCGVFDSSVVVAGIRSATDSTVLDHGMIQVNGNAHVVLRDLVVQHFDSSIGTAVTGGPLTTISVRGNSRLCHNKGGIGFLGAPTYSYPGVIYSQGIVNLEDHTLIDSNMGAGPGAVYSGKQISVKGNVIFKGNEALTQGGGAINTEGDCFISGNILFDHNTAAQGGGAIWSSGNLFVGGGTRMENNYTRNIGGGAILINAGNFKIADSVLITQNSCAGALGNALRLGYYAKGAITGAQIVFNGSADTSAGPKASVYSTAADSLTIKNTRLYNPLINGTRQYELYLNSFTATFISDTCWWGASDTAGLIRTAGGVLNLNSWVIANWSANDGIPLAGFSRFPVKADFTLQDHSSIKTGTFGMLKGIFNSSSGTFSLPVAPMSAANTIKSDFTSGMLTTAVTITASVDADTFTIAQDITGTGIAELQAEKAFQVFPNPATGRINISKDDYAGRSVTVFLCDLLGRVIEQHELYFQTNLQSFVPAVAPGVYVLRLSDGNGHVADIEIAVGS